MFRENEIQENEKQENKIIRTGGNSEESLDPADWGAMRDLGHRMVDDMMGFLENVRERPVWQPVPGETREFFEGSVPERGEDLDGIYREFSTHILPYAKGNIHPRFWGWVHGTGTPFGMLAEMLAAGMNSNLALGDHSAVYIEEQVMNWCKEMLGYAPDSRGLLVSGGSMANLLGLAVGRNAMAPMDIRKEGLQSSSQKMVLYCSSETHNSVQKAVELLGLGSESIRYIPVDKDYRINPEVLKETIAADRAAGYFPFCIVGNAGTVNTGAIDPLEELSQICKAEGLWFHVDGAFGLLASMLPEMNDQFKGMEIADSVAFDLHKWMYMPYEVGCFLVRDPKKLQDAFVLDAGYLMKHERGIAAGPVDFKDRGPE
ncbi:MAG: aminotransferase class V-fold PLP-dependent enzyme, partial [bacterium]|nr:aminotransferase class V-fold PLP-dependent enzyme [bacterium]